MRQSHKWIGLAEIHQRSGVTTLGRNRGAFVTAVSMAPDEEQFVATLRSAFLDMGFELMSVDEIELYSRRSAHHQIDERIRRDADLLDQDSRVVIGTFHTFRLD